MATTVLWFFCFVPLIYGRVRSNTDLEERVRSLEKRGLEQDKLIKTLLERLDRQEDTLQAQSQTLEKQQLLLNSQQDQLNSQLQTLEKQQLFLQDNARDTKALRSMLWRQGVKMKNQARVMQTMRKASTTTKLHDIMQATDGITASDISTSDKVKLDSNGKGVLEHAWSENTSHIGGLGSGGNDESSRTTQLNLGDGKARRLALDAEGPVAFHAVIDKSVVANIGINQNIVFDVVLENLGGAYHNQHGIFIAPVNGVYIFSVTILSDVSPHPEYHAALNKDGVILGKAFGHGDSGREDQGSVTVVTQLQQGNEVWVSLEWPNDDSIFGERFSSFMGCLVYKQ